MSFSNISFCVTVHWLRCSKQSENQICSVGMAHIMVRRIIASKRDFGLGKQSVMLLPKISFYNP